MPQYPAARKANRQTRKEGRDFKQSSYQRAPKFAVADDEVVIPSVKASVEPLVALTERQAEYGEAIDQSRVTFGVGPAGTGKTWFAVAKVAELLKRKELKKVYLTRPAIGTDEEDLGFLPGDLEEKYEPYLRPFRDAFVDRLGSGFFEYLIKTKVIEPVPLGFLRGMTIKNAVLMADEMQNATRGQFKMLLTRIGQNSQFIINGDPRQIDLENPNKSGLEDAITRCGQIEGFGVIRFERQDIVRDDIIQDILERYDD